MKIQIPKTFQRLLLVCNIVFLACFIMLGFFNMPALDDFCFINAFNKYGFLNPFTFWYKAWSGRLFPIFILNFVYYSYQVFGSFLPYTLILIGAYIWTIYQLILKCTENENRDRFFLINVSTFLFFTFLFVNYKFNTFYWINASSMYYGGILCFLLIANLIFKKQNHYFDYFLVILLGLYAGTSMEHHVVVFLAVLLIFLFYEVITNKLTFSQRAKFTVFSIVFVLIGFLILINAPGTKIRMVGNSVYNGQSLPLPLIKLIPAVGTKLLLVLAQSAIVYLPFLLLCTPILLNIVSQLSFKKWPSIKLRMFLGVWFIATFGLIALSISPVIYVLGMIGPQRVLIMAGAIFFVSFLALLVYLGNLKTQVAIFTYLGSRYLGTICLVIIIANVAVRGFVEFPKLNEYRENEKSKVAYLQQLKASNNNDNLKRVEVQNAKNITYHTATEVVAEKLLRLILPNQAQSWKLVLRNESIMPNYIDAEGQKVNEACYCNALELPFKIKTLDVK